jgi:metallo-beta-lactamase class B
MMRILLVLMMVLMAVGGVVNAQPDEATLTLADDLTVRELEAGVYLITHAFPWPANSLLVEMADESLVLVDTPYTAEATAILFEWIDAQFGVRDIVAINTGFHVDNLGGNAYLIERGIPVYGSDLTPELLDDRGEDSRELMLSWLEAGSVYYTGHRDVAYVPPTELFPLAEGLDLTFGQETVQVYYPGPTHAADNVVVWFPDRQLLFGGCMVLAGERVGNIADADMVNWPVAVARLARFEFETLIPGHGDRTDPDLLAHTIELLTEANQ